VNTTAAIIDQAPATKMVCHAARERRPNHGSQEQAGDDRPLKKRGQLEAVGDEQQGPRNHASVIAEQQTPQCTEKVDCSAGRS
jgi:hypothetical protein